MAGKLLFVARAGGTMDLQRHAAGRYSASIRFNTL
jgi:hypothetical protein